MSRREITQNNAEVIFLQDPERKGPPLELTFYHDQRRFIQADYENRLFDHLAFGVKHLDKTIALMRKEGITIMDEPFRLSPKGRLIAFVEDPDGTLIEVIEKE